MSFFNKLFGGNKGKHPEKEATDKIDMPDSTNVDGHVKEEVINKIGTTIPNKEGDDYIKKCLENKYQELEDERWFSHFKELPEIDRLKKIGDNAASLELCLESLETHSDSFLFYSRASVLYTIIDQPQDALKILQLGLLKSLSKCSLAQDIADIAFKSNNYRDAIFWWIQAGVIQIESKNFVEFQPFLNLAYLCQPIGFENEEKWFFSMADKISTQGPIRFNSDGAVLRHKLIQQAIDADDNVVMDAIKEFCKRYKDE